VGGVCTNLSLHYEVDLYLSLWNQSSPFFLGARLDRVAADTVGRTFVVGLAVAKLVNVQRHTASGTARASIVVACVDDGVCEITVDNISLILRIRVRAENAEQSRRWHIRIVGCVADPSICRDRTIVDLLVVTHMG
jgi:hypothetical protein